MDLGTAHSATGLFSLAATFTRPSGIGSARPGRAWAGRTSSCGFSAADHPPPPVQRLAARGDVLLGRADALEEREGPLDERLALAVEAAPGVVLLAGVAREVEELGLVVRAAKDQGPLGRRDRERHVVGDPARPGVYGGDDLDLREVERPGAHHQRPVLLPRAREHVVEGLARDGARHASEPRKLEDGRRYVGGRGHSGADRKSTRLNSSHANISYAVFCLKKKINLIFSHDALT